MSVNRAFTALTSFSLMIAGIMIGPFIHAQSAPAAASPPPAPAATAPAKPAAISSLISPGLYEKWNGDLIDRLEIKESFRIADYAGVRVFPVEAPESALPPKETAAYKDAVDMIGLAQRYLVYGMKQKLKTLPVTSTPPVPASPPASGSASAPAPASEPTPASVPASAPAPVSAASSPAGAPEAAPAVPPLLLFHIRAVKVSPGTPEHYYGSGIIIAMMTFYGKTTVELEGELLDGGSGRTLLTFSLTRASKESDSRVNMMVNNFTDAGSDLGKMLTFFK